MVRVNLDDLAAELLTFDTDEERGQWLAGFQVGASGTSGRSSWSEAKQSGWGFGAECHLEATDFRETKARGGRASVEARRSSTGSAQPQKNQRAVEHCSSIVRTVLEHTSEQSVEQASNQPTANSQQPEATAHQSSAREQAPRMTVSEWSPLQEHRDLAAVRNADVDLQLSRFRERNNGQTDTDQGWSVRFRQWLGASKPERSLSREAVASPTIEEWMSFARSINDCGNLGKWPKQAAEAGWQENQAKGWRYVTDWQADCRARVKRWEANEATQAQRRRS